MVNVFHAYNAAIRANVYIEYVKSEANIADLPSRGKVKKMIKILKDIGVPREQIIKSRCIIPKTREWTLSTKEWIDIAKSAPRRNRKRKRAENVD